MERELVIGVSVLAAVGGGFRSALIWWALRRGEAHPPGRARTAAIVFTAIALAGVAGLVVAALDT